MKKRAAATATLSLYFGLWDDHFLDRLPCLLRAFLGLVNDRRTNVD
jgi:hypothetical protein